MSRLRIPYSARQAALLATLAWGMLACIGLREPDRVFAISSQPRGGYLEVTFQTADGPTGFYLPPTRICRALSEDRSPVAYYPGSPLGHLEGAAGRCTPVGSLSLVRLRDAGPRPLIDDSPLVASRPNPRPNIAFHIVHRDADVIMARGRFPLARQLGWLGHDLVAVVPATDVCIQMMASGRATMAFRKSGLSVFQLSTGLGVCPILGLAQPLHPHDLR
ncbi:MAG: hypothetical protein GY725_04635 [bacterium]|nr:hypothetical protein [bacterium]